MKCVAAAVALVLFVFLCGDTFADGRQGQVFNVRDQGAKGDGKSLDTGAIQKSLDACRDAGGGTVLLPPGTYLSQPLILRSKTTLLIEKDATLRAIDDPAGYKRTGDQKKFHAFLSGEDLHDVTIAGRGVIDGQGARWWADLEAARQHDQARPWPRPNLIELARVTNLIVRDITLLNAPKFHLVPADCNGVTVTGITILSPEHSPNTDGIDPMACRRVTITGCTIDCGDDNIAIKAGEKMKGREFACEDIYVADCTFKHGHGMSIGSETVGGVRNVRVKNCTFENTGNGIRIKSNRARGGRVEDILYEDIRMKDVHGAITLSCLYADKHHPDDPKTDASTMPHFSGIVIRNLEATSVLAAGMIVGLPESPIKNVTLENVSIKAASTGLEIRDAQGVRVKSSKIEPESGKPYIVHNSEVDGAVGAGK